MSASRAVAVTTTAARVDNAGRLSQGVVIQNLGPGVAFLGGSDVTTANGIQLEVGATLTAGDLYPQDEVFAVSASTADLRVWEFGLD